MKVEERKKLQEELEELYKVVEFLENNSIHVIDVERLKREIDKIEVTLLMEEGVELIW